MNTLQLFIKDGVEIVINIVTGESFSTISGYARMSGLNKSTVSRRVDGVASEEIKNGKILTAGGLQGVALIPAKLVFKWLLKDNPELAEKMGEVGATAYLHREAGFKIISTTNNSEPEPEQEKSKVNPEDLNLLRIGLTSVNASLVDGLILNELGKIKPELRPQIKEAQKLLAATNDIPEVLLTPTVIGKQLNISAVKVNQLLIRLGLQMKNPLKTGDRGTKTLPDYVATTEGEKYSNMTMATGSGNDNTTYQHLKWKQNIVDILSEYV